MAPVFLSILNLYYHADQLEMMYDILAWSTGIAEYDINGKSSTVLKGKVHHWKPHQCFCGLCAVGIKSCVCALVCVHTHHNQTITGLIFSMITPYVRPSWSMLSWNEAGIVLFWNKEEGREMSEIIFFKTMSRKILGLTQTFCFHRNASCWKVIGMFATTYLHKV